MKINKKLIITITAFVLFLGGITGGYIYFRNSSDIGQRQNKYVNFLTEIFDVVIENYWEKAEEENLIVLYEKGVEKLKEEPQSWQCKNRACLQRQLEKIINNLDENKRQEFSSQLADIVLANLQPFGRSRLYVEKDELALQKRVKNLTDENLYQKLGVEKEATTNEINQIAEEKIAQLEKQASASPEVEEELAEIKRTQQVLGDEQARKNYDLQGIAPTIHYNLIQPEILHLHLTKFSPTTLEDLQRVTENFDQGDELDTLIFDLRDNVGGAIDGLPYFLGPFIGYDQYAFQFFHQGEREDHKTELGWMPSLVRYKKVVFLINENTQSSAEVFASVVKKYNVGVVVGTTTKGWGTVERVFSLENQISDTQTYSIFLVHRLTLRDDGQPIEDLGVEPDINIENDNWQDQLYAHIPYPDLISAVNKIWND